MQPLDCPSCKKPLTFWNFAKALTPFHLECDHCQKKVRFDRHAGTLLGIAIVLVVLIASAIVFASLQFGFGAAGRLVALGIGFVLLEALIYALARVMGLRLLPRDRR